MLANWNKLLSCLEIVNDENGIEIMQYEEIKNFENIRDIVLPESYKDFCQTFGTGVIGDFVTIYCPSDVLVKKQEIIDGMIDQIRRYSSLNPTQNQAYINLLSSAFMFGENAAGGKLLLWDLRTYSEVDKSYNIYWADWETPEVDEAILVGRNFFGFVQDFCLGTTSFEVLPEAEYNSPDDIPKTFFRSKAFS